MRFQAIVITMWLLKIKDFFNLDDKKRYHGNALIASIRPSNIVKTCTCAFLARRKVYSKNMRNYGDYTLLKIYLVI